MWFEHQPLSTDRQGRQEDSPHNQEPRSSGVGGSRELPSATLAKCCSAGEQPPAAPPIAEIVFADAIPVYEHGGHDQISSRRSATTRDPPPPPPPLASTSNHFAINLRRTRPVQTVTTATPFSSPESQHLTNANIRNSRRPYDSHETTGSTNMYCTPNYRPSNVAASYPSTQPLPARAMPLQQHQQQQQQEEQSMSLQRMQQATPITSALPIQQALPIMEQLRPAQLQYSRSDATSTHRRPAWAMGGRDWATVESSSLHRRTTGGVTEPEISFEPTQPLFQQGGQQRCPSMRAIPMENVPQQLQSAADFCTCRNACFCFQRRENPNNTAATTNTTTAVMTTQATSPFSSSPWVETTARR